MEIKLLWGFRYLLGTLAYYCLVLWQEAVYCYLNFLSESKFKRKTKIPMPKKMIKSNIYYINLKFHLKKQQKKDPKTHLVIWIMKWLLWAKDSIIIKCMRKKKIENFGLPWIKDNLIVLIIQRQEKINKLMTITEALIKSKIKMNAQESEMDLKNQSFGQSSFAFS